MMKITKLRNNHNILSLKEIKDLTTFFLKEEPDRISEKIDDIQKKINSF